MTFYDDKSSSEIIIPDILETQSLDQLKSEKKESK